MWTIIGTWRMALDGIEDVADGLAAGGSAADAVEGAVRDVEDNPYFKSVGFGGLPNEEMDVECDAAFMNGDTLEFGAVGAARGIANPVSVARSLAHGDANNFLVGEGATRYAAREGFEIKNMLTDRAIAHFRKRVAEEGGVSPHSDRVLGEPEAEQESARGAMPAAGIDMEGTSPDGHDTVGIVALDANGSIAAATSTSGLFMKRAGRVGDSPVPGAGFYADSSAGAAASTGLGEDVMKGCVAYEIVRLMGEGMHPQDACERAISSFDNKLKRLRGHAGDISFVAVDTQGRWGAASNIEGFSFVVRSEGGPARVYLVHPQNDGTCSHEEASEEWQRAYMASRTCPIEEIWHE